MIATIRKLLTGLGEMIGGVILAIGVVFLFFGVLGYDDFSHGTSVPLLGGLTGLPIIAVGYGIVRLMQLLRAGDTEPSSLEPDPKPRV